ncbi:platelet binding protein GspB [Drosophila innubila]|uniref:platelet binding protein GspB n=1 Tax=Drosophila innubila TaxID=198719 RepID=UPI00148C546D|nr:platelet binding protein GspB [Drosophila innubila]
MCIVALDTTTIEELQLISELIAGNEFLKLLLDHDEQQRSLHSEEEEFEGHGRLNSARSLEHRTRYRNANGQQQTDAEGKQVVKLVTTGSKIVFLDDAPVERHIVKSTTKPNASDEVKVVAVSVSSSSRRGSRRSSAPSAIGVDFVNRSHKSELSIEETEPRLAADVMDVESDSLNSASNIQNVLAAPLLAAAASSRSNSVAFRSSVATGRNVSEATAADDKLLPFQTVIYHDTGSKQGHGPQSRSISYSSISQNVDDLHLPSGWHKSAGILAEAQRNVSDSLKPMPRLASEPAKFYSVPAKMYSVPSKFYSEPAKVYSEPAKMYGQPEKVYSEPAKVYGQPSKFYSEPAKVYSQPAKVYGEPAKTYWPLTGTASTTSSPTTTGATATTTIKATTTRGTTTKTTRAPTITTTTAASATVPPGAAPSTFVPSRRPAIVSRIAFGEAQTTTATTTTTTTTARSMESQTATSSTSATVRPSTWQQHYHQTHNQQLQQQQQHQQQHQQTAINAGNSQPRRVLFNLDRLPYDLLNAPQPQPQQQRHLLEPILSSKSPSLQQQQHRPCWEQQPQQQQQQRQHSSLSLQHSNQNAKGLPNRDLVKCVSKFAQHQHATHGGNSAYSYISSSSSSSSSSSAAGDAAVMLPHFTTERAELYTPTPEQNYEIEESVSVMTNGRAHGLQGGSSSNIGSAGFSLVTATTPATPAITTTTTPAAAALSAASATTQRGRNRGIDRGRGSVVYNANANANDYDDEGNGDGDGDGDGGGSDDGYDGDDGNSDEGRRGHPDESDDDKVAYVVEGRNYRKYRVEEKTDDGFIVGEYGVVDHNDGNLSGVRYTADSTIDRSLIQKGLLTFLKLK